MEMGAKDSAWTDENTYKDWGFQTFGIPFSSVIIALSLSRLFL
jgi:hypothetical protein